MREDYHRIVYTETLDTAQKAREAFLGKWKRQCPGVVASLEEAGENLLTEGVKTSDAPKGKGHTHGGPIPPGKCKIEKLHTIRIWDCWQSFSIPNGAHWGGMASISTDVAPTEATVRDWPDTHSWRH